MANNFDSNLEYAQAAKLKDIGEIAESAGIDKKYLKYYGNHIAKVSLDLLKELDENSKKNKPRNNKKSGKLILVTAITPTSAGEGKSTTSVGLAESFARLGKKAIVCLREPSLGPVFGVKGGATGGGCAQVLPMEDINLHFTGDIHAITAAHNLLAAMLDNHLYHGNKLNINTNKIIWKRALDMNDRALRHILIENKLDKNKIKKNKSQTEYSYLTGFEITAASEVMAILALSKDLNDLKFRLGRIIVAYTKNNKPVTAKMLKADGSMAVLLRDALMPNLVQTYENTPAFIHCGPFGNIAHGCSSIVATKLALRLADIVITEAGFATELGAEKFFNIKCRQAGLKPDAVVIVATVKALRINGIDNLGKHIENIQKFNLPVVVAINKFKDDNDSAIKQIIDYCSARNVDALLSEAWHKCGFGNIGVDRILLKLINNKSNFKYLYNTSSPIKKKIEKIAKELYGAKNIRYTKEADAVIKTAEKNGYSKLPICMAKTHLSLSDNPILRGAPKDFTLTVTNAKIAAGAGFIVAYCGNIMTMPGLPKTPAAEKITLNKDGKVEGLF
ncbi:TPA: formate--tetrahydrofolate ligase [Candidatus Woesearchaeota archaeon]|nr:formate--tetrahydrofolate ligase [Candidatus Woesearchaeota archaeon]